LPKKALFIFILLPRAILHDETVFVEPDKFKPERFINNSLPDPADSGVFGFGRRWVRFLRECPRSQNDALALTSACAGKSMAMDTIWIAIASILSVYNISKAVDDRGNIITPEVKLKPGTIWFVACVFVCSGEPPALISFVSHPAPFKCQIEPRSKAALALIQHAGLEAK